MSDPFLINTNNQLLLLVLLCIHTEGRSANKEDPRTAVFVELGNLFVTQTFIMYRLLYRIKSSARRSA